ATALTEVFAERGYQFLVFDPEGDYEQLENAVTAGDVHAPPGRDHVLELLNETSTNVVVNTLALQLAERPAFFADLQAELASLRARTGRPHWLIVDEAHHLLPTARDGASLALSQDMPGMVLITVPPMRFRLTPCRRSMLSWHSGRSPMRWSEPFARLSERRRQRTWSRPRTMRYSSGSETKKTA